MTFWMAQARLNEDQAKDKAKKIVSISYFSTVTLTTISYFLQKKAKVRKELPKGGPCLTLWKSESSLMHTYFTMNSYTSYAILRIEWSKF